MTLITFLLAFIFLYNCKINRLPIGAQSDYLSKQNTLAIKGVCAILVVLHHCSLFLQLQGDLSFKLDNILTNQIYTRIGVVPVALFFFLSGYGLELSYKKRKDYLNTFLTTKLTKIVFPYIFMFIIYSAARILFDSSSYLEALLSIKNGATIVTYSWYVLAIIYFYIAFYISHKITKKRNVQLLLFASSFAIYFILFNILNHFYEWGGYWADAVLANLFGVFWYHIKPKFNLKNKVYYPILALTACLFLLSFALPEIFRLYNAVALPCVFLLILIMIKVKIGNKVLYFLGKISFELYMFHGLAMKLISKIITPNTFSNTTIYEHIFLLSIILFSVFGAYILHKIFTVLFYKRRVKK